MSLTEKEISDRFNMINSRQAEDPTVEERAAIEAARCETDSVSLEDFRESLEQYSGRIVLRIPRSLHKHLKEAAAIEGVSLNQYMLYKLSH